MVGPAAEHLPGRRPALPSALAARRARGVPAAVQLPRQGESARLPGRRGVSAALSWPAVQSPKAAALPVEGGLSDVTLEWPFPAAGAFDSPWRQEDLPFRAEACCKGRGRCCCLTMCVGASK